MIRDTWIAADSIVSPLGYSSKENFDQVISGKTGISLVHDEIFSPDPFFAAQIRDVAPASNESRLETIAASAISEVLGQTDVAPGRTALILSTTKGNISFLEEGKSDHPRILLAALANYLEKRFGFSNSLVVSNACISGVMALLVARRMILSGQVNHVLVAGVDVLSRFIVSGFQSLQAMSSAICRPFDAARKGINLGEAAGAILITSDPSLLKSTARIRIAGGGLSNDANHISGPSRTGAELAWAIQQALNEAKIGRNDIDFVSAHGTATVYNDEMEAKAFALAGLNEKPVHSLKGYYGHTLGAAGVIEVALNAECLRRNFIVASPGYDQLGVSQPLNVLKTGRSQPLNFCLKTASGFGGCNAAIILTKEN